MECKSLCPTKPIQNQIFVFIIKMFNYRALIHFPFPMFILNQSKGCCYDSHTQLTPKSHFILQGQCRLYRRLYYCHFLPPEANGRPFLGCLPRGPVCPSLYNFTRGLHPEVNNLYSSTQPTQNNKRQYQRHVYKSGTPSHILFKNHSIHLKFNPYHY